MKLERLTTVAAALALLASPVLAADHPNMSGTWTIDASKSDFGATPVPSDLVLKITVEGQEFRVVQTGGGGGDFDLHFNTAGREATNDLPNGTKMTSTHHWEGDTLVGEIKFVTGDGSAITFKDRIGYSPDGKVMTLQRAISGPTGDSQMKLVLNRK
jgi:hypothetical protein